MKRFTVLALACLLFPGLPSMAQITNTSAAKIIANKECDGAINAASMVALGTSRATATVFNHNGGTFDAAPLLSTTIEITGSSCIIATFSANSRPSDNAVVYQVRMDGKPLEGHITAGMPSMGTITVPFVVEPDDGTANKPMRMGSFTFFGQAKPGRHKIEVLLAACCSANMGTPPGNVQVDNATLVVQYNKN